MNFGHIYMIFFVLWIGMLIGMALSVLVVKIDEKIDRDREKAKDDLIEEQEKYIEVLKAYITILEVEQE